MKCYSECRPCGVSMYIGIIKIGVLVRHVERILWFFCRYPTSRDLLYASEDPTAQSIDGEIRQQSGSMRFVSILGESAHLASGIPSSVVH